jgi:anti-anti-sigma regulatory factor
MVADNAPCTDVEWHGVCRFVFPIAHRRFTRHFKNQGSELMSPTTTMQAHIAYELIDEVHPEVVAVEFLSSEIVGPAHARELREQLDSLIRPELPHQFVIDLANVRSLGSSAFGEIVSFARRAGRLFICNMRENLRLGATLIGLDDCAEFTESRRAAINRARRAALGREDDTVDYPASWVGFN